jgi:hypothetical protein
MVVPLKTFAPARVPPERLKALESWKVVATDSVPPESVSGLLDVTLFTVWEPLECTIDAKPEGMTTSSVAAGSAGLELQLAAVLQLESPATPVQFTTDGNVLSSNSSSRGVKMRHGERVRLPGLVLADRLLRLGKSIMSFSSGGPGESAG